MRKGVVLVLLLLTASIYLAGCGSQLAEKSKTISVNEQKKAATSSLNHYYASIDYSCKTDSDCEIKDIGNCCGHYLQCINMNSKTDTLLVSSLCEQENAVSICSVQEISSCTCKNRRCEPK